MKLLSWILYALTDATTNCFGEADCPCAKDVRKIRNAPRPRPVRITQHKTLVGAFSCRQFWP